MVAKALVAHGLDVSLERETAFQLRIPDLPALAIPQLGRTCDLAIVVGGDGTMLRAARKLALFGTPLVGINQGRLGFVTDIAIDEADEALGQIVSGNYLEDRRTLLLGSVWRNEELIARSHATNDVVVSRGGGAGMIELSVHIGDEFAMDLRGDGLIVSSATGSTAHALAAGGPILHPALFAVALVPIAAHTLSNRPIVLSQFEEVRIRVLAGQDASAHFDGEPRTRLLLGDKVCVHRSAHVLRFLHPAGWSHFKTLRENLGWHWGRE
jgi:NAD+ kinase